MESVQSKTANEMLLEIKTIFKNFDANVPIFDFYEDGKFCSYVRVKDYLYLKSQIECVFSPPTTEEVLTRKQEKQLQKEIRFQMKEM